MLPVNFITLELISWKTLKKTLKCVVHTIKNMVCGIQNTTKKKKKSHFKKYSTYDIL